MKNVSFLGLSASLIMGFIAMVLSCSRTLSPDGSDNDLEKHFAENSSEFSKLISMLRADEQLTTIYRDGSFKKHEIKDSRGEAYQDVINAAGLQGALIERERSDGNLLVTIVPPKVSEAAQVKGYAYSTAQLSPTKSSLDTALEHGLGVRETWYKEIGPNWYIFLYRYSSNNTSD